MIVETLGLYYHVQCFRCCVCRAPLGSGRSGADVRVRVNKLHCHNCYSNDEGSARYFHSSYQFVVSYHVASCCSFCPPYFLSFSVLTYAFIISQIKLFIFPHFSLSSYLCPCTFSYNLRLSFHSIIRSNLSIFILRCIL